MQVRLFLKEQAFSCCYSEKHFVIQSLENQLLIEKKNRTVFQTFEFNSFILTHSMIMTALSPTDNLCNWFGPRSGMTTFKA